MEADQHWQLRAGVIMPDHVHLLVWLAGDLPIPKCVARLKAKTRATLLAHNIEWQPNFYEHRLRPEDQAEDVVRYIFLNPYRAGLVSAGANYPWFWLGPEESVSFKPEAPKNWPHPEWLR